MAISDRISDERCLRVAATLYQSLLRSRLQEALASSKLLPRGQERNRARGICVDEKSWSEFVAQQLSSSATTEGAFRLLGSLIDSYINQFNTASQSGFHRALRAAEKGDISKLSMEIEKLKHAPKGAGKPPMEDPVACLFLATASPVTRSYILRSVDGRKPMPPQPLAGVASSSTPVEPAPEMVLEPMAIATESTPALAVEVTGKPDNSLPLGSIRDRFLARLAELVRDRHPRDWNLPAAQSEIDPPQESVDWPSLEALGIALSRLKESTKNLLAEPETGPTIESLPGILEYLRRVASLADEAKLITTEMRTVQELAQRAMAQALSGLPASLSARADEVREKMLDPLHWNDAIKELSALLSDARLAWNATVDRAMHLAHTIQEGAAYLPDTLAARLAERVRLLVVALDLEGLEETIQKHEADWKAAAQTGEKVRTAAGIANRLIEADSRELPAFVAHYCGTLVESGDAVSVRMFLEHFFAEAAPSPGMAAMAAAASEGAGSAGVLGTTAPDETLLADISGFKPRNRRTAAGPMPADATAVVKYLYERAIEEMRAGSILGITEHAFDILELSAKGTGATELWACAAISLLAAPPAAPGAGDVWGPALAEWCTAQHITRNPSALITIIERFLASPGFDEAFGERFVVAEIIAFSDLVANRIFQAAGKLSVPVIEDVARAIGYGVRYGDTDAGRALLIGLARSATVNAGVVAQVEKRLDAIRLNPKATIDFSIPGLEWLAAGGTSFADSCREMQILRNREVRELELRIPLTVARNGGFAAAQDSDALEIALLISNVASAPCANAEIHIPASSNTWLASDVIRRIGPMQPKSRTLVALRLPLGVDLTVPGSLPLQCGLAFREVGARVARLTSSQISVPIREPGAVEIAAYRGADSQPIILTGGAFDRSPRSVRDSLTSVRRALSATGTAAMVIGRRRRGKTSFLTTVGRDDVIRSRYCVVSDSVERQPFESYLAAVSHLGDVLDRAARQLNLSLEIRLRDRLAHPNAGWAQVQEWLIVVSRALKRQTNVLLLLDEFQKWLSRLKVDERANLLGIFRGLRNRPGDEIITFSVVLAGLSNLREYANASLDFKAAFDIYDLRPFNATETESLIRSNETIEFDRRAVERIRQLSGGNPFLINLLGNDIAEVLRSSGRGYCLPEDVQVAVRRQLDLGEDSRVWRYLEYLLRKDEEDTGARIAEFPAVVALARTVHSRAILRTHVSIDEISAELASDSIEFDRVALQHQLKEAEKNELVERSGDRYCLASGWLGEWLAKRPLVPVKVAEDPDLVLNRYKIVGHRKGGGQASVYDAVDTMLTDRRVVLKIYSAPEGQSRSFEREVKALCTLRHPNIVECLTYGFDEKRGGVLVLGPVNGEPLAEMIDRHSATAESLIGARGDLSLQVKFIEALADALNACHSAGVIHKDVSAGNVIVYGKDGLWHPVLIDFGIASRTEEARIFATTGAYTPGYVAPERHTGQPRRAPGDVYCLGVIGYELLTGRNPFPSDPVAAAQMQRVEDFTPIADLRPELPIPLAELIERMLKADPAERPDALTVAKSLRASLQPLEWNDYLAAGREAYTAGASKRAYDSFEVAMISAPEGVLQSQEYLEGLEDFVAVAKHEGKLLGIGVSLVDRLCWATNGCDSNQCAKLAQLILKELVDTPAQDQDAKTQLSGCLARLAEIVWNNGPIPAISTSLPMVLEHLARPAVWDRRHDLFLIAHEHTLAKMFPEETLGHWCVRVSRLVRERGQAASESQLWLQRAGNLGMRANPDYVAEQKALAAALPANDSARLPEPAAKQDPASDILGTDEQGHFNGERMTRWASRLLRCYPWVSTVRRLKGDGTLEKYPTRMLDLNEVPRHASPFPALDPNRLIPAVLDASFAKPANSRVVRINIVLSEGTTAAQREAAIASLRHDAYLFPEG